MSCGAASPSHSPGGSVPAEFRLGPGPKPRRHPQPGQPCPYPLGLGVDEGLRIAANVLEQLDRDGAIGTLSPAADDPAVQPDGRARVAVGVEQRLAVLPEE